MEVETVRPVQMNIFQINNYKKDLDWLYFDDEPRVQEKQQVEFTMHNKWNEYVTARTDNFNHMRAIKFICHHV